MTLLRRWWAVAVTSALLALAPQAHAANDTLRIRLDADVRSLDPGTNRDGNTDIAQTFLFEGLVAFKEDATVGPMLAKSVDLSPDEKTYTFTLRDGVSFSNGNPMTSADVLFAWKRYTDPKTGWRCLPEVDGHGAVKVVSVEAPNDKTVVFTLEKPSALFLATLARPDCGQTGIFHQSSLAPDGSWREPVTTAPFKVGEWKRGQYLELLKNEHYAALSGQRDGLTGNKSVQIPKVRLVIIPDEATAKAALMAGNIDLNMNTVWADLSEYKANPQVQTESTETMDLNCFLIQTKDPVLADPRIRRAFLLSLDMDQLVDQVTFSRGKPNNSPIPTTSVFHKALQAVVSKRDLAQARKLLADAKYNGRPIKMITNKNSQAMYDQSVLAQAMAREAGLNIELEVLEWGTQQDRYLGGNYQLMSFSWSARLDPSLSFEMFTGDKAKQVRKVWDNPEALRLLTASSATADPAARQGMLDQMEALFRQDIPMVPIFSGVRTSAARTNVVGYSGWALGSARAWGVSFKQ